MNYIRIKQYALFIVLFSLIAASCEDNNENLYKDSKSINELNKEVIQVNVTNISTGFQSVFKSIIIDSTSRAKVSQAFVDNARFFEDNSGYFFIQTLKNAWVVAHINHDFIGTSRINATDLTGKYHVQEIINTVKNIGYGFVRYVFVNPVSGEEEQKLSFVTDITPPEWFVGAGVYDNKEERYYETKIANRILVKEITRTMALGMAGVFENFSIDEAERVAFSRNFIEHIRFFEDQSGYFFILDYDGLSIAHAAQPDLQGQNLWDLQDAKGTRITREMIEIAKNNPNGDFFEYYWENPSTLRDEKKTSFIINIPGTNYFIGAGIYQE